MAKKSDRPSRSTEKSAGAAASKAAARHTQSAPADSGDIIGADLASQKQADTDALVASMPHNPNKSAEHGRENAGAPPQGDNRAALNPDTTASTLTERIATDKVGAGEPVVGENRLIDTLDAMRVDGSGQMLTTNQGVSVGDNQNSLKAGLRGPTLLEDFILREKITHFDHERIPERIVHARGSGAHGFFECYEPRPDLTRAAPFQGRGKRTPVFVRFSTVAGERGSMDTARDVRGFAVKFYTDEGNWDLVGNNIPVFFIQDAMKFPDLVHAVKPEPHHQMPQAQSAHDTFWDFVSLMPESTHMLLWIMSDRAIPRSYRMMQGFGVHTFRFINDAGESRFVKFHWSPKLGTHSLVWDEALKLGGADPDFHRRDLWEAIEAGAFPEWELGVQIFTEQDAERFSFDILDATKIIPEELIPLEPLGRLVLNRNPDYFFGETEQVAFCTAHVIPGIDFTNDPLLAGRIHSYVDTQITRLGGPNFHQIPINAPIRPVFNNQRDGLHQHNIFRGRVSYEPNSLAGGCPFQAGAKGFVSFPEPVAEDKLRGKPERFAEHYAQARLFYESQTAWEQAHIAAAFRFELSKLTVPAIRARMVAGLRNVSEELASQVAEGLGMQLPEPLPLAIANPRPPEVTQSAALSLTARPGNGDLRTRQVAFLVADGVDGAPLKALHAALTSAGAAPRFLGPRLGNVTAADGEEITVDATLENSPPMLFDAVVFPSGKSGVQRLTMVGQTIEFVMNQFRHNKPMLVLGESARLLDSAGIPSARAERLASLGVVVADTLDDGAGEAFLNALAAHRFPERETDPPRI